MDAQLIENIRRMNQLNAWCTFGESAIAVVSEGTPGKYDDNPTIKEHEAKGYKLVDANMFGQGGETGEILIFIKKENTK